MSYRIRNRFVVALALALSLAGVRAVMSSASPSGFPILPDLMSGEGEDVTLAVAALGFPNVTYAATGLPPGLSISTGLDANGHVSGFIKGTLGVGAPGTDPVTSGAAYAGAEGLYDVTITASDGSASNTFRWDIGRWGAGDVFVGIGEFRYQVYSKDGVLKYAVVTDEPRRVSAETYLVDANGVWVPDENGLPQPLAPELGGQPIAWNGVTSGCAANWHTGETWAANFDDVSPGVNVITRHAGNNARPYTDLGRRVSTERYSLDRFGQPYVYPDNANPESVAFDNAQNMYVGHSFGFYNNDGWQADVNGNAVWYSDPQGLPIGLVTVDAAGFPIYMQDGNPLPWDQDVSPAGVYESWTTGVAQLVRDLAGQPIPLREQKGMDLFKFPVQSGNRYGAESNVFNTRYGYTGTDATDLLSDQRTMVYTSESRYLYRYDVVSGQQLPVVGSNDLNAPTAISDLRLYGLRALPPGDGTGGYLAATWWRILRVDANGRIVQQYDVQDNRATPEDEGVDSWFSIAVAPDGRTFWAASLTGWVYRFDIVSGQAVGSPIRATDGVVHTNAELAALCVMNEYRAAQEVCGPTGRGNGIDDDRDGLIDEGCFRIETCSIASPGDDDGDGLADFNDPDCGAPPQQVCATDGPTADSVAGFCERANVEGETISIGGIASPCGADGCADWTIRYTADNLPDGLTMDPQTGQVTGVPAYTIVNPNDATAAPVVFRVVVHASWQYRTQAPTTFDTPFPWTIYNANRPPVAVDDGPYRITSGASIAVDVRVNDSDPDTHPPVTTDVITISGFTQPVNGTVVQVGQNLVYTAPHGFSGTVTFLYQLNDDYDTPAPSNWATVTVYVNDVPVAVNDSYTTQKNAALTSTVTGNDTASADGGNVWTQTSNPANGTVTMNANGAFTYTPNPNFTGIDSFTYKVCDVNDDCATATVTIRINDVPVANDDGYTTAEDTPITASVVANDVLSADGGHVWSQTSSPANGTVVFNANGTFTYTPNPNFNGTDSFTYKLCDVDADCDPAIVTITITPVNDLPVAVNDAYTTPMNTPVISGVQANDTPSGDGGNVWSVVTPPTSGSVTFSATGAFTYTPATGAYGTFTFTYKVCDVDGDCSTAVVTIVIPAPCGTGAFTTYTQGGWGAAPSGGNPGAQLAANFSFVFPVGYVQIGSNSRYLRFTSASAVAAFLPQGGPAGTLSASATNAMASASGVFGGQVLALQLNVSFSDMGIKRPGLRNQVVKSGALAGYTVGQVLALANAVIAGGALPSGVTLTALNTVVDAINNDYDNGLVDDGYLSDDPACAAVINVPVARDDAYTTAQGVALIASVAPNDTLSTDGGNVWSMVTAPVNGNVKIDPKGTFTYTPDAAFVGTDMFTYKLCDKQGDCDSALAAITVTATNDVPVVSNDAYAVVNTTTLSGNVSVNDDPSTDGGNVWTRTSAPASGAVAFNSDGTFTYTPVSGFTGVVSFTYKLCDVNADCATATVTITVTAAATSVTYVTYTQGGWGATPSGSNPGALLAKQFATVYAATGYVQIGSTKYARFTSASAIDRFLPAGGTAARLTKSVTNPKSSAAGVFAGQVLALQLNVDFSKAGVTTAGLAALKLKTGKLAGYTVQQVLDMANGVLGGSIALPSTVTLTDLNAIVDAINKNFDNGTTNSGYLG